MNLLYGSGMVAPGTGEGSLSANGAIGPIRVVAKTPEGGAFVFHLAADAAQ